MRCARALLVGVVTASACPPLPPPPGTEALGDYVMVAEPERALPDGGPGSLRADGGPGCGIPEVTFAPLRFEVVVTREPSTGAAWLTLGGGYPRDAGWDGQVLDSTAEVRRLFPSCAACPPTLASERILVALLSRSQSDAVNGCPALLPDGGLPALPRGDGITPPRQTMDGFDALYACGSLEFRVTFDAGVDGPDPSCPRACGECVVRYTLTGERR